MAARMPSLYPVPVPYTTPSSATLDSVERLFPDFREVEREYFQRTGMFPIMHTIVIRTDVYEENPWVARELTEAFTEAKDIALANLLHYLIEAPGEVVTHLRAHALDQVAARRALARPTAANPWWRRLQARG